MSNRDNSAHLTRIVKQAIEEHGLAKFAEYWKLYERASPISHVQAFYIMRVPQPQPHSASRGGYYNVALIGDGLLVDIEGDDNMRTGSLTIQSLGSVTKVSIHAGSLPGLRNSQNAKLVVIAGHAGETEVGLHWVATTEAEEGHLLEFAHILTQLISSR